MGGGGGGYSVNRQEMEDLKREVRERTERSMQEAEINGALAEILASINDRDVEKTRGYLEAVEAAVGEDFADFQQLLFGGSVAKHTYVNGLSDVDSLVVMGGDELADLTPAELRTKLHDCLGANLPKGEIDSIETGNLAVTVNYSDGTELQLLPARRSGDDNVEISSADGTAWRAIHPRRFAKELSRVNSENRGTVVPTIKLMKSIVDSSGTDALKLSGYHVEAMALKAFEGYDGGYAPRDTLTHCVERAASLVRRPIADVTNQSTRVDEYLGGRDSEARKAASTALTRIAEQMKSTTTAEGWRELLGL